ncbi:glycoside hydrolase family 2 TIM barrel-domain containing protein [Phenylobacterium montanum]|uniref:DUF4982 domain-containing protein n=1 Tax=Phenylobacterium montanum TaxID=2823693 RepID=A0A975IYD2_9CAUL|nr:glycoside hydrolase family 2 TIM barrel-domain containing protein [Caulobacter sp. S6]QUD90331.1 DUF4982 domain-containing protein [Caulobacter sp. S6]
MRAVSIALASLALALASPAASKTIALTTDWRFFLGDPKLAERPGFDDHEWRRVSVPHDWSIEDPPGQAHPFDKDAPGGASVAYTDGGVGWYRHLVDLPRDVRDRTVLLRFEAVYMDAQIWVNGASVGRHANGYTAFTLDISDKVKPGANTIAVRVHNEQPSSRWYSGSGIIRPARLEILDRVHIDPDGPTISTPSVSSARAEVRARTIIANARKEPAQVRLDSIVIDSQGREVGRGQASATLTAGANTAIDQAVTLDRPALWSPASPALYTLVQDLVVDGALIDRRRTRFGVRSLSFDAERGLLINGEQVRLRGGAIHSDSYMLGGISLPRADERKLELMKAAGYNAIRSAHNPPSAATLEAADRLGMLVIDEAFDAWTVGKKDKDYGRFFKDNWKGDVGSMVAAGRNHPSVIMWSIGNEIPELSQPSGRDTAMALSDLIHQLDPTRPVTSAVNQFAPGTDDFIRALDVVGYNYFPERYAWDHATAPARVMYGSESFSGQAFDYWSAVETMPWVVGDFVWTGFDYLGEASIGWTGFNDHFGIGPYPWQLAMSGEIDATGHLRPSAYYRQVLWKTHLTPTSAFVEWPDALGSMPDKASGGPAALRNWVQDDLVPAWEGFGLPADYMPHKVAVFSENEEVELFVNGRSLGRKPTSKATEYKATFWARFEPGELKAVGYVNGKPASQWVLQTAGALSAVRLAVDRPRIKADGEDLAYVTAELVDAQGRPVWARKNDVGLSFKVLGAGVLAGVGNGDPVALESFQSGKRSTYHGRAVAVVRAGDKPGAVQVEVTGAGLPPATLAIEADPPPPAEDR